MDVIDALGPIKQIKLGNRIAMLYEIQIVDRQPIDYGNKCEIRRNI